MPRQYWQATLNIYSGAAAVFASVEKLTHFYSNFCSGRSCDAMLQT